ncbi:MAG TPA: VWA domain-containing protein [Enhygromyxa sp.]|nr:VWA domain-containing protein [Enhygromyxa sp.]
MKIEITTTACALALAALAVGCSDDGGFSDEGSFNGSGFEDDGGDNDGDDGSSGLDPSAGQGGAQDFGLFRQILLAGGIPGPETIDDLGFFAEHKIAMPKAECGQNVCIHGLLGVMGNMISGSNCTIVMLGMNTPIDPETLERPPLNLAIAVDLSGSMSGEPISRLREGLLTMIDELEPDDRISLIGFADDAELLVSQLGPADPELAATIEALELGDRTNLYAGLRAGFEEVQAHAEDGRQNRVILVSDGVPTVGLTNRETIEQLAGVYGDAGFGLTTIGIGDQFDIELMRELAEIGSGSFYYIEEPAALEEVFAEEVQAFVVPLAEDVEIDARMLDGYDLRRVYGTTQAEVWGNDAYIDIPILQIAHRVSADDNENGRRGGGGAIILELTPTGLSPAAVGEIDLRYRMPGTGELIEQQVAIASPLGPWETPPAGHFESQSTEKGFVMLNIYVGFEMAASRASVGDYGGALTILRPLRLSVRDWLADHEDADIEDDLIYIELFIANLEAQGGTTNTPNPVPPEPWPSD